MCCLQKYTQKRTSFCLFDFHTQRKSKKSVACEERMTAQGRQARISKELELLTKDPPPGIVVWTDEEDMNLLQARLAGSANTPYSGGRFILEIRLGPRYPFEAPSVRFVTKIFHPNVDESGRICLDSLKLPPSGSWRPSLNLAQVLSQIQILLSEPGLSDPLMKDVAELYKNDRSRFMEVATEWTSKYATGASSSSSSSKRARTLNNDDGAEKEDNQSIANE